MKKMSTVRAAAKSTLLADSSGRAQDAQDLVGNQAVQTAQSQASAEAVLTMLQLAALTTETGGGDLRGTVEAQLRAAFELKGSGKKATAVRRSDADSTLATRAARVVADMDLASPRAVVDALQYASYGNLDSRTLDQVGGTDLKVGFKEWRAEFQALLPKVWSAATDRQRTCILLGFHSGSSFSALKGLPFAELVGRADFSWLQAKDAKALAGACAAHPALWKAALTGDAKAPPALCASPELIKLAPAELLEGLEATDGQEEEAFIPLDLAVRAASDAAGDDGSITASQLTALLPRLSLEHLGNPAVLKAMDALVKEHSGRLTGAHFETWARAARGKSTVYTELVQSAFGGSTRDFVFRHVKGGIPGPGGQGLLDDMKAYVDKSGNTDDVVIPALKDIMGARFDFEFVANKSDEKEAAGIEWGTSALGRVHGLLNALPQDHVKRISTMVRVGDNDDYAGVFGGYGGGQVQLGFDEAKLGTEALSMGKSTVMAVDEKRAGIDQFDHSVRHEIGHAVDVQQGIMTSRRDDPTFGGWRVYGSRGAEAFREMAVATGELSLFQEAFKAIDAEGTLDKKAGRAFGDAMSKHTSWEAMTSEILGDQAAKLETTTVAQVIQSNDSGTHWSTPAPAAGDHIYSWQDGAKINGWQRHLSDARDKRGLSHYQFKTPQEWFAEVYAFYFDGKDKEGQYGSMLGDKDPSMKKWMDTHLGHEATESPVAKK